MNYNQRKGTKLYVSALPLTLLVGTAAASLVVFNPAFEQSDYTQYSISTNRASVANHTVHYNLPEGTDEVVPRPIDEFMERGLKWLAAAQQVDGGWGGGSHASQQLRDPLAVKTDPGTTAFTAMAFLRAGNTTTTGPYKENVRRALDYLLKTVENYSGDRPTITDLTGTQPQVKLGQYVDVALCSQFFSRVLPYLKDEPAMKSRVEAALDKCTAKIQNSQKADGSWNHGGWAPVLSTTMANNALENAQTAGRPVDDKVLQQSREYQKNKVGAGSTSTPSGVVTDVDGPVTIRGGRGAETRYSGVGTSDAAGVALYSISSNQRVNAVEAKRAKEFVTKAQTEGKLAKTDSVSEENLVKAGMKRDEAKSVVKAYVQNESAMQQLKDDRTLSGFGNNGGEEFLSYMLTSESLVLTGGTDWVAWTEKMHTRLSKIQNEDGSWSGHHCITSPVFCTAAVILCLTADRDPLIKNTDAGKAQIK